MSRASVKKNREMEKRDRKKDRQSEGRERERHGGKMRNGKKRGSREAI